MHCQLILTSYSVCNPMQLKQFAETTAWRINAMMETVSMMFVNVNVMEEIAGLLKFPAAAMVGPVIMVHTD